MKRIGSLALLSATLFAAVGTFPMPVTARADGTFPRHVLIIRHAEKPPEDQSLRKTCAFCSGGL